MVMKQQNLMGNRNMVWNHTISLGRANWIYKNEVHEINLADNGQICFVNYHQDYRSSIYLDPLVLYKKEVLLEPSNHSLVRLSNEVAESLFWINKEKANV
jgi:hypothetical protein